MAIKKSSAGTKRAPRKSSAKALQHAGNPVPELMPETLDAGVVVEEEIRVRAYELYEARGRQEGFDREDWSQAEAEVRARRQKRSA